MSAPSGIKVPPAISAAFGAAKSSADDVRALVFTIEGESFSHLTTVKPKGSYAEDIELLAPTLPSKQTPASFAYRLDSKSGGAYEWMMVTFVPDDAGVRAKMLQASSRGGLMKALGAGNFKHDWFATSIGDLTPRSLTSHLDHILSPPPLTASEAALAEIKAAEAEEAKSLALDTETQAARRKAVVGLGGRMKWNAEVQEALTKAAARSDDGWVVSLDISPSDTSVLQLRASEACKPSELASKLPDKAPAYVFYSFPTPPPPKPAPKPAPAAAAPSAPRNTFQATAGGVRYVSASTAQAENAAEGEEKEEGAEGEEGAAKEEAEDTGGDREEAAEEGVAALKVESKPASPEPVAAAEPEPEPEVESKGRVVFIYWCPSGSPVKFRMIYSTSVRGVQQDAIDKAGVEIHGKIETSDRNDVNESHLRDALPAKPKHASSLPNPGKPAVFGAPAPSGFGVAAAPPPSSNPTRSFATPATRPVFGAPAPVGAAFGRPMPIRTASHTPPASSSSPVSGGGAGAGAHASAPTSAVEEDGDSKDRIQNAFNAFGPRINSPGGGGGFARPRPAGRR
ncbi:Twinfilin-1 [Vanrija albida]|uniref:Twinfilin-1 n=1 Tax=Vanrija albida TaxID=181172 RepID=A0ABR3PTU1_9TREE